MNYSELFQTIENGIRNVYDSSRYQRYLETMSHFHSYSLNNCLLIFEQKPEATLVAGYQTWRKEFGRHVKFGEKGIRILAPVRSAKKEESQDETDRPEELRFKSIAVFDISQTEGNPLPTYMTDTLYGTVKDYDAFLEQLKLISPVPVIFSDDTKGSHGFFRANAGMIAVRSGMPELQTVKTLVHEIAHACLHNKASGGNTLPKVQKEIEAESVAYILCKHFGLDTGEYSFGYLAGYSSSRELPELRASMERIRMTSDSLIKQVEFLRHPQKPEIEPAGAA
ncbi:MAG: ImmA/IrrE family metallo-endopeptidase [Solobacterium sp.]|nr:ImmA/IrrE family metallo-endopeptidase [Solobacterium sp.]